MARRQRPVAAVAIAAIALFPLRQPLLVDGRIGLREWVEPVGNAAPVQVRRTEQGISLLVHTDGRRPVHVYIEEGSKLRLLHASSALGEASYERGDDGSYRLLQPFVWTLADPARGGPSRSELAAAQHDHLERAGWVASTSYLGERGVVEFRLAPGLLSRPGVRWGVGYLAGGEGPQSLQHYPPGAPIIAAPDDELALLEGATPLRLHPAGAANRPGAELRPAPGSPRAG